MPRRLEIEPVKKVFNDSLAIEVTSNSVHFYARIDGTGNEFRISKWKLVEFIKGG